MAAGRGNSRRFWTAAGLIALAVVTAALVAAALLRAHSVPEPASASGPGAAADPGRSASPGASPSAEPSPSGTPAVAPGSRMLSAFDGTTAWRSVAGACPGDATSVESSTDAGVTWQAHDPSTDTEAAGLYRLEAANPGYVYLVAGTAADDCAPQYLASYTGGDAFAAFPDRLDGVWFLDPASRALHAPGGTVETPCAPAAFAPRDADAAAVLCPDGTIVRTLDGGSTWSAPLAAPGVVALDDSENGYVLAALGRNGCDGVAIESLPADGGDVAPLGCAPVDAAAPGEVAVSAGGGAVWLWAGSDVRVSADGGVTW